jgi:DNA invertase Pin-like site-specific DNA recombinase
MVTVTSRGLRLLAYGRVSDVRGRAGESFISPEDQMRHCRNYAKTYDHTIIEEGLDLDISGGVMSRPVLDRFLETIRDGKAQGLIVAKLDRFARSSLGALNALAEIEAAGGVLISVQEQIDSTTAAGRFVRAIFLATAEWERERIGESWLSAKTSAVERGIHISAHVPPGYRRRKDRRLEPHPKHGKTIREAFEMAARGEPYSRIANYLNERELPSDNGRTFWGSNRIRRLLANRVYLGEARYGSIVNPEGHEPIVSPEAWALAQRQPVGPALSERSEYLLTGLCRCAECLYAMRPQKARGNTVATYRCQTDTAAGRCPHPSSISMSRLEEHVLEQFLERAPDVVGEQLDEDDSEAATEIMEAERAYREIAANADLAVTMGATDFARLVASLKAKYEAALANAPTPRRATPRSIDIPALVEELQAREDVPGLRELLGSTIQAVLVSPAVSRSNKAPIGDRVRIVWSDEPEMTLPKRGIRYEGA